MFIWRYGRRSFTRNTLFEHGWGFSGHGAAWQDIAMVLEKFMADICLPLPLGRNEALRLELERFTAHLKLIANAGKTSLDSPPTALYGQSKSQQSSMPHDISVSNAQSLHCSSSTPPIRQRSKRLRKLMPLHSEKPQLEMVEPPRIFSAGRGSERPTGGDS